MGMLMMASFMTSCDNHEPYDPDLHIGYVLCDDHTCMDTATYFNQSKRKAVGVVFAEKTKDHPVLAVNLLCCSKSPSDFDVDIYNLPHQSAFSFLLQSYSLFVILE